MPRSLLLIFCLCLSISSNFAQSIKKNDILILFADSVKDEYCYKDLKGDIIIPFGKYSFCFTDTFRTYAIVLKAHKGFVAIDRQENILYEVFPFENGPDYTSDGLFRITENDKIGYADSSTGKIIIKPKFDFATPFIDGLAEYYLGGPRKYDKSGEHWDWVGSYEMGYINKSGKRFGKVIELDNNKREAWTTDDKHVLLNKAGQIIYTYPQRPIAKSFTQIENKIIDTIAKLQKIKERMEYLETQTKGKRHLQFTIWEKPTKSHPYYWVKVIEYNGVAYYTHFNFYVYAKTMKIKFYDTINDKPIDLNKWEMQK